MAASAGTGEQRNLCPLDQQARGGSGHGQVHSHGESELRNPSIRVSCAKRARGCLVPVGSSPSSDQQSTKRLRQPPKPALPWPRREGVGGAFGRRRGSWRVLQGSGGHLKLSKEEKPSVPDPAASYKRGPAPALLADLSPLGQHTLLLISAIGSGGRVSASKAGLREKLITASAGPAPAHPSAPASLADHGNPRTCNPIPPLISSKG